MSEEQTCSTCTSNGCSARERKAEESAEEFAERQQLESRLCRIKHKVFVLSGKGGVGKSTLAVNMVVALSLAGKRVGILDIDIHGPSVPHMLGLQDNRMEARDEAMIPIEAGSLKVVSIGFLLSSPDQAVIWRGPMKMGVIKQFLKDVAWGELDYLVIDCPPGTGDEPLSIAQLIPNADGAVIVTTPQEVALADVRKCVDFCERIEVPVLGVIENMSGFACPKCGEVVNIFKQGGGEKMAADAGVPFLGAVPIDPTVVECGDKGCPFVQDSETPSAQAFAHVAEILGDQLERAECNVS